MVLWHFLFVLPMFAQLRKLLHSLGIAGAAKRDFIVVLRGYLPGLRPVGIGVTYSCGEALDAATDDF